MDPRYRVSDVRRHRYRDCGELVSPDASWVSVDAHRDRHEERVVSMPIVFQQQPAYSAGGNRQQHVIDGDTQPLADRLDIRERQSRAGESAFRPERVVHECGRRGERAPQYLGDLARTTTYAADSA